MRQQYNTNFCLNVIIFYNFSVLHRYENNKIGWKCVVQRLQTAQAIKYEGNVNRSSLVKISISFKNE